MKIALDENVCLRLARELQQDGHDVVAVAELKQRGYSDDRLWSMACDEKRLLITRDYHFTNPLRFDPSRCLGIIFVRHGNLKASDEAALVRSFLAAHSLDEYRGHLVSISKHEVRVR